MASHKWHSGHRHSDRAAKRCASARLISPALAPNERKALNRKMPQAAAAYFRAVQKNLRVYARARGCACCRWRQTANRAAPAASHNAAWANTPLWAVCNRASWKRAAVRAARPYRRKSLFFMMFCFVKNVQAALRAVSGSLHRET